MKKLKYLLFLALASIVAVGVLAGCSSGYVSSADNGVTPYTLTYCANGGLVTTGETVRNPRSEAIFRVMEGARAFEPGVDKYRTSSENPPAIVGAATRDGYIFVGWAKGKVDEEGKPALLDKPITNVLDDGIYVNKFGSLLDESEDKTGTAQKRYYDYDRNDLWDFKKDRITEDVCLVAVWENYNKFMIAQKDENGEWEDTSDIEEIVLGDESNAAYNKYKDRLVTIDYDNGTAIEQKEIVSAYKEARPDFTVVDFYLDEDCTKLAFDGDDEYAIDKDKKVTVFYYQEIKGNYTLVKDGKEFESAYTSNANIYLMNDVELQNDLKNFTYTGEINGNGKHITATAAKVTQTKAGYGAFNSYGGLFGELKGAKIHDVYIECSVGFEIAIDPDNPREGTANDKECHFGLFAKVMDGCIFNNVKVNVTYEIGRSLVDGEPYWDNGNLVVPQVPNTYSVEVIVYDWAPRSIDQTNDSYNSDITIFDDDCSIVSECIKDER